MSVIDARAFAGKTFAITGGSGFIGGRLAERLVLQYGANARALLRGYDRAARLARFPCEMKIISLAAGEGLREAIADCGAVFHCAYDFKSPESNLAAIDHLIDACIATEVPLIHLGTISIYEPLPDGPLDEDSPADPTGFRYGETKLAIDERVLAAVAQRGLRAVILMPTIVYGPFGRGWTDAPIGNLLSGRVILPRMGEGLCNPVYIDDVCDAMLLAVTADGHWGHRLFVSGPEPVPWKDFYGAYERALGIARVDLVPERSFGDASGGGKKSLRRLMRNPKELLTMPPISTLKVLVPKQIKKDIKQRLATFKRSYHRKVGLPQHFPSPQQAKLLSAQCTVSIEKARRLLRYEPEFSFERGMAITAEYVRWAFPDSARRFAGDLSAELVPGAET